MFVIGCGYFFRCCFLRLPVTPCLQRGVEKVQLFPAGCSGFRFADIWVWQIPIRHFFQGVVKKRSAAVNSDPPLKTRIGIRITLKESRFGNRDTLKKCFTTQFINRKPLRRIA